MKSPPAHRVLGASHKYMSLYGLSGTLKRWNKAHEENQVWFIFPDDSKSFYTVLKEAKARAVWVAQSSCAGRLSSFCYQWEERERQSKRKQAPSGWKFGGLKVLEQLCGGCAQKCNTSLCWLFRKYRLLTLISQLGGLRSLGLFTPSLKNLPGKSTRFILGDVTGSCAHANRGFLWGFQYPLHSWDNHLLYTIDYPAWEKSVRIYSLWKNLLFSCFCSVARAP